MSASYALLKRPDNCPCWLDAVLSTADEAMREFRSIACWPLPSDVGPQGTLQKAMALLILTTGDSLAQLLNPAAGSGKDRFVDFHARHFPEASEICGPPNTICAFDWLYSQVRNPLVHRLALRPIPKAGLTPVKFIRSHTISEMDMATLESSPDRPNRRFLTLETSGGHQYQAFWIESYYWGLRRAAEKAVADPNCWDLQHKWLRSDLWSKPQVSKQAFEQLLSCQA